MRILDFTSITEEQGKTAVFAFGRMNPPTIGHKKLADAVLAQAGDPYIFLSQSQKPQTDPLDFATKLKFAQKFFPGITVGDPEVKTVIQALTKLDQLGYDNIIYIAGSDRIADFTELLNQYNGQPDKKGNVAYKFNDIQVVSAGERDPDAEGAEGMSASKMRAAAAAGEFEAFASGTPDPKLAKPMYDAVRSGMGIAESTYSQRIARVIETLQDLHRAKPLDEATTQYVLKQVATIREHSINEKRRFPDKNQKESLLSSLLKYEGQNVFISFQRVKKLGINPRFNFDGSPLGVYSYFLPAVLDDFKKLGSVQKGVDFGSERPYVFVFKVNDLSNVINVETYSNTNLKKDLKRLNLIIQDTHEDANKFFAGLQKKKRTKYPFEILMTAIAVISEYKPSYMRKLFVQLGYYGIMDNVGSTTTTGHYTIKESIFFSTEHIKVIDMFINHNPNKDDIPYKDGKYIDDPFSTFDVEYDYTEFAGPAKKVKTVKPDNNRPLEIIEPGLTPFKVGDKISQEEYDEYKEYGLEIKNDSKIKEHLNNIKEATLDLPDLETGDELMVGKFKNRKATIKDFKKDDHGQPVAVTNKGDQKIFKGRVKKLMPTEGKSPHKKGTEKYRKHMAAMHASAEPKGTMIEGISYADPQFDVEWEEANRYPYLEKLGSEGWEELAKTGRAVRVTTDSVKKIGNTGADGSESLDDLEPEKVARLKQAMDSGTVEMPIVVKQPDGSLELIAGNTRLIGLISTQGEAQVWLVDASTLTEVTIDNKNGRGAVPNNQEVDYFGMRVKMKPSTFIALASKLGKDPEPEMIDYIKKGGAIGAPFLSINSDETGEKAEVTGHEGRNRMLAIMKAEGDVPVEVHLFFNSDQVNRARHLTPELVSAIKQELISQDDNLVKGPLWEGVGRIVKGVNTTPDVGVNQTKIEAAKLGSKVDKDGRPPVLERGSIGVPLSSGLTVNIAPHRELKIKKSTMGRHNYENPRTKKSRKS